MKKRRYFFILFPFLLFVLSAFSVSLAPLFATALPAGRMLDEGHDTGYIDWNGSVYYENLYHRDGLCPSGCNETVTRINSGSSISGSLEQDASYFEAMAAFEWAGAGTAGIRDAVLRENVIQIRIRNVVVTIRLRPPRPASRGT